MEKPEWMIRLEEACKPHAGEGTTTAGRSVFEVESPLPQPEADMLAALRNFVEQQRHAAP